MSDLEERVKALEGRVDLLRRAIGLLTASATPTVRWLDASWKKLGRNPDQTRVAREGGSPG